MANRFRTRPSQLLGIEDPYIAYCFDEAAYTWGMFVQSQLKEAEEGAKKPEQRQAARDRAWNRIFKDEKKRESEKGVFRDPATMFSG